MKITLNFDHFKFHKKKVLMNIKERDVISW